MDYIEPMLSDHALPQWLDRFNADGWIAEIKMDGHRVMMTSDQTYSRTGHCYDLPMLQAMIPAGLMLDGELLPYTGEGYMETTRALGSTQRGEGLRFVAFDVMIVNGDSCSKLPMSTRRNLLVEWDFNRAMHPDCAGHQKWWQSQIVAQVPVKDRQHLRVLFHAAKAQGREGLMLKHVESRYTSGNRSQWRKLKVWG